MDLKPALIEGERWTIGLNPTLLLELAAGMGAETVTLEFSCRRTYEKGGETADHPGPSNLRPIMVRPLKTFRGAEGQHDAAGLLMPIRVG